MNDWIYVELFWDNDFLSAEEIIDVEESWEQIKIGNCKTFQNVDEFLRELKT